VASSGVCVGVGVGCIVHSMIVFRSVYCVCLCVSVCVCAIDEKNISILFRLPLNCITTTSVA
jgi:hypothetical protein